MSKTTQLSIRLNADEKAAFNRYATHMRMTQRDAFMYLLHKYENPSRGSPDWNADNTVLQVQQQSQETIDKLTKEIENLQKKLEQAKNANPENAAPKMTARYHHLQELGNLYFVLQRPKTKGSPSLPRYGYKRFVRKLSPAIKYVYPTREGCYIFFPEALLYGESRPPVYFWVGRLENGQPCKIRICSRWDYFGVHPLNDTYALQGSRWLVSLRRAADGAMDLIAALPLDSVQSDHEGTTAKVPSLDQRIADIEHRRK